MQNELPSHHQLQRVLITGATGFMGRAFVRQLLQNAPDVHVWALVRPDRLGHINARPELLEFVNHPRFDVIGGDIRQPGLGLASHGSGARYTKSDNAGIDFDTCIHFAAATDFRRQYRKQTMLTNVGGTRNVIDYCEGLAGFEKFYHISTAYVCGSLQGVAPESLLSPGGYLNPYEESKSIAERIVAASSVDWSILRPSILMGDSATGRADIDKMVYGVVYALWKLHTRLQRTLDLYQLHALKHRPLTIGLDPSIRRNLICVDDAVNLALQLVLLRPEPGTIYHLTNPTPTAVATMFDAACEVLGVDYLEASTELPAALRPEERFIQRSTQVFRAYMTTHEPHFDQSRMRGTLKSGALTDVKPLTPDRLRFLFHAFLAERSPSTVTSSL